MKILSTVKKVPGGLMVVPLLLGVLVNTFFPGFLEIGGLTTALWGPGAASTAIAITCFCVGAQINVRQAGEVLKRGFVLLLAKFAAGASIGILVGYVFGLGGVLGISALAMVSAITNSNGGLFISLTSTYGDSADVGSQSLLAINDGPFLTMIAFGASGLADIPLINLVSAILPVAVGMLLGNLDKEIGEYLEPATGLLIPFFAFCLGSGISVNNLMAGGLRGIVLGVFCVFWSGFICILADRFINRRPGYAGASVASAAGNCVATPALIAAASPVMAPYVDAATVQCASAVVVSVILVPLLTAFVVKKWGDGKELVRE
ncbi:MAG: 2-keto-3-deoxygluconate permease [Clostridiales bacterium]|nr:2-keto-3-deoxygluconate permease [Clostridiales bacterium]